MGSGQEEGSAGQIGGRFGISHQRVPSVLARPKREVMSGSGSLVPGWGGAPGDHGAGARRSAVSWLEW